LEAEARAARNTVAIRFDCFYIKVKNEPERNVECEEEPRYWNSDRKELEASIVEHIDHDSGERELREPVEELHVVINVWRVEEWFEHHGH